MDPRALFTHVLVKMVRRGAHSKETSPQEATIEEDNTNTWRKLGGQSDSAL
jgi:hypothetical protein